MEKWSLTALADGLLSRALSASSRRDMRTIDDGPPHLLYQSVIADRVNADPDDSYQRQRQRGRWPVNAPHRCCSHRPPSHDDAS